MDKKNKILLLSFNWLIYLFPLFYICGNFFINASILLISIIGLALYKWKIFDFRKDNLLILTSIFFLIIVISTFFESISNPGNVKIYKSIIFLRYFLLLLVVRYALINNHVNLKKFLISCLIFSSIISSDVILQFITGQNIIGFKSLVAHRSSFFIDEAIAGGFIQRFSILGFFITLILFKKSYLKVIFSSGFLLLCFAGTFYSGNKMPTLMLMIFAILFMIFLLFKNKIYKNKKFIFSSFIALFVIFLTVNKFSLTTTLYNLTGKSITLLKQNYHLSVPNTFKAAIPDFKIIYSEVTRDYSELNKYKGKIWFHYTEEFKNKEKYRDLTKHSIYNHIYITSLDLILEDPMIGRGIKSFREICKEKVHLPNRTCSSHQHNFHLQILNDTGLIGYIVFFSMLIFLILSCLRKTNLRSNIYFCAVLAVILIEFFPFRSTGGFFSTTNSAYIFLMIGMLFGFNEQKKI